MKVLNSKILNQTLLIDLLLDLGALCAIYFLPAAVHFTGIPMYMIEPMRLMLILSLAHASKYNSYLLALSLPYFSYVVSGHPEFIKMLIITGELILNVAIFYWMLKWLNRPFIVAFLSIIISKTACYLIYWPVFSFSFVVEEASMPFLIIQFITTFVFSLYVGFILKKKAI
jgi:hypothetical protein